MSKNSQLIKGLIARCAAVGLPWYATAVRCRVWSADPKNDPARLDCHEPAVYVFWHEFILTLLPYWGWSDLTLLISQHRDAEWLSQIANRLGYRMIRGSSTRGGAAALKRIQTDEAKSSLVFTPDGPKGPRRVMAPGALYTASKLNLPIVPVGVGVWGAKRLKTWDRLVIPYPLGRARVIFGERMWIPNIEDRDHLAHEVERISKSLNELTNLAQAWAENRQSLAGYRPENPRRRKRKFSRLAAASVSVPVNGQIASIDR